MPTICSLGLQNVTVGCMKVEQETRLFEHPTIIFQGPTEQRMGVEQCHGCPQLPPCKFYKNLPNVDTWTLECLATYSWLHVVLHTFIFFLFCLWLEVQKHESNFKVLTICRVLLGVGRYELMAFPFWTQDINPRLKTNFLKRWPQSNIGSNTISNRCCWGIIFIYIINLSFQYLCWRLNFPILKGMDIWRHNDLIPCYSFTMQQPWHLV